LNSKHANNNVEQIEPIIKQFKQQFETMCCGIGSPRQVFNFSTWDFNAYTTTIHLVDLHRWWCWFNHKPPFWSSYEVYKTHTCCMPTTWAKLWW